ncbi:MAG: SUMF1/EgtB/PvdO family nonheme iron enzyme [Planctomycetaceae bacterium]|nr:SUMF1/EgtB/PvdO family nonheme iron enzyme [Planctomycetaceae bacterium]
MNSIRTSGRHDEWMDVAFRAMEYWPQDRYQSVKEFQEALANCRVHHDSIVLTREGDAFLEKADAGKGGTDGFPRAINAYDQALVLWPDNARARSGLAQARRAYARHAVREEDFAMAISLLESNGGDDELLAEARQGLAKRVARRRAVRLLGGLAAALLLLVALVSGVAYVWISRQAEAERAAREEAETQRVIAQQERVVALEQRAAAEESRRRAEDALGQAEQARLAEARAQQERLHEQETRLSAEEQARLRAEEALRAQQEIQRLGYLEDNSRWRFDADQASRMQTDAAAEFGLPVEKTVQAGAAAIDLVLIPPGEFVMGSPPRDPARNNDEYLHEVVLTRPFHLSRTEVTRGQWQAVVGVERLADLGLEPGDAEIASTLWRLRTVPEGEQDLPATGVSHDDITTRFLPALARLGGEGFRLPTEAEWEWAVRAGTTGRFYTGDTNEDLARAAWYENNAGGRVQPVGGREANAWGLHDMLGNAWELVADSYDALFYLRSPRIDPVNLDPDVDVRVSRGGSYINSSRLCRMSYRATYTHRQNRYPHAGFRLAWSGWGMGE